MEMLNPLDVHHEKMGAKLGPGRIPLFYSDVADEYWALKKSAGIVDLSHLGRLTITGRDHVSFLNGLLTNDLTTLSPEGGIRSALLNTKARVLADLHLYRREDSLLVETGDSSGSRVKAMLDQFIITEDVQVRDSSQDLLQVSVQGPKAAESMRQVLGVEVSKLTPLSCLALGPSLVLARDRTGLGGYDIIVPRDEAEAVWQGLLLKGGDLIRPVGLEALEVFRLEIGLPRYGVDVDENVIVLEAGFRDAISFTKGCYMGQEVVARATHIGRVNRTLVQLEVESQTSLGSKMKLLSDGKEAGFLTSSAFSPERGRVVGLGYVLRDFAQEGTRLAVDASGTSLPAVVVRAV